MLLLLAACHTPPHAALRPPQAAQHPLYKVGDPYEINGVWYYPAEDLSYDETGIASWYGEDFHGKYTANGETFDLNALTAAHRTLPMPSVVQVTNLENGRTIKLRVNDRGPYLRGRIIDVSRRAAQLLGFEGPGTAKVRVRIVPEDSIQAKLLALAGTSEANAAPMTAPLPVAPVAAGALPTPAGVRVAKADLPLPPPAQPAPVLTPVGPPPALSEHVAVMPVRPTGIYVQAGAFSKAENATRLQAKLSNLGDVRVSGTKLNGSELYRVRIGPLPSVSDADQLLDRVVASGLPEARIVVD
ncbi:MAG TPA: septal ring lytic transglycosylase RlpA family protein [Stellaceae bacterium]|nr:septal ring lytic transglycosylase RlpA family protein [Stellaceae bacterium]